MSAPVSSPGDRPDGGAAVNPPGDLQGVPLVDPAGKPQPHRMLSIVIPAYNEQDNVEPAYERLRAVMEPLALEWELIFSVDPCTDRTEELIVALCNRDPRVKMLRFSRRFGQPMATIAGLDAARGRRRRRDRLRPAGPAGADPGAGRALARRLRRRLRAAAHTRWRDAAQANRCGARLPLDPPHRRRRNPSKYGRLSLDEQARRRQRGGLEGEPRLPAWPGRARRLPPDERASTIAIRERRARASTTASGARS